MPFGASRSGINKSPRHPHNRAPLSHPGAMMRTYVWVWDPDADRNAAAAAEGLITGGGGAQPSAAEAVGGRRFLSGLHPAVSART